MDCINQNLKGLRKSKNTQSVIEMLLNERLPVSAAYIFDKIKEKNNNISLSTVYRIIDKLCACNVIRQSADDGGKALYELVKNGHRHYIICTKCKKMTALDFCPAEEFEKKISSDTGFHITGHKYEIYGECSECLKKDKKIQGKKWKKQ